MEIRVKEEGENNGSGSPDTFDRLMIDIDDCDNLNRIHDR
jgi:hypothetical protein